MDYKISTDRFHERLSESLLRLGCMKTKHYPGLWMVEKSSHDEYLAKYVDEILFWRNDTMEVINSLEKTYILKRVKIP
jgi:predicted transcriptional regulator